MINKRIILSAALIVIGVVGMVDSASATYEYHHNPKHDYKFDNQNSRHHGYRNGRRNYNGYRNYRHSNDGYRNHSYRYPRNEYYDDRYYDYREYPREYSYSDDYYSRRDSRYKRKKYKKIRPVSRCFNYRVTVAGGKGGFRFQHNKKDFKRVNDTDYVGKICGYKNATFELSKVDPSTYVSVEINGQRFEYGPNAGHDKYINHWYRKYYSVNLKYRYD